MRAIILIMPGCGAVMAESTSGERFVGWNVTASRFLRNHIDVQQQCSPNTELEFGLGHSLVVDMTALREREDACLFVIVWIPHFFLLDYCG